jgi:hypothetical protein
MRVSSRVTFGTRALIESSGVHLFRTRRHARELSGNLSAAAKYRRPGCDYIETVELYSCVSSFHTAYKRMRLYIASA